MDGEALEALRYFSDATHPQSFVTLAGRGPVLVSAPHAVLQTRSGRLKAAERYTGMLCLMLNRRHDVPGIYKARHLMDDANHDPSSPYRNEVCRLIREGGIRCVLDLHQLRPDRSMALCIGTGRGRHVRAFEGAPDVVRSAFMRRGLSPVTLDDPLCGVYRLSVEKTRVCDLLGLVGFSAPPAERREFPVEPDLMELRLNLPLRTGVSDDSDSYSQERPGYDFADTFQLREYVPGDSAKQIHWKLSSKLNRLVVRDPGLPLERSVLLLWERRAESEAPQQASAMAEMVISLARELLRQGVRCCVAWNDAAGQDCALYELEDESALYDMLPKLLSAPASPTLESVAELYLRQYGRANGKTVFVSAGGYPALERVCDPAELVGLFCAAELPQDFPGRGYCFSPDAEAALYEIDLY